NGGSPWTKGGSQPFTQFYEITADPANASRQMGGTQDNNTLMSSGTPSSWFAVLGGDGFYCLIDPTNPNIVFAEYQFMSNGTGPQRSTGGSYTAPTGFNTGDRYNWDSPRVMDPPNHT